MSAAARAEARRKAILSRGSDRLSKLTTSARGEDAGTFVHDDPPVPSLPAEPKANLTSFLGEDTPTPTSTAPRPRTSRQPSSSSTSFRPNANPNTNTNAPSPFDAFGLGSNPPDPSVWSEEQQQQFMRALLSGGGMGAGGFPSTPSSNALPSSASSTLTDSDTSAAGPSPDDPLMALMNSLQGAGAGARGPDSNPFAAGNPFAAVGSGSNLFGKTHVGPPKPKTLIQKLLPLLHVLAMWCLVAFFVLWKEPEMWVAEGRGISGWEGIWNRWAELGRREPVTLSVGGVKGLGRQFFGVQAVPFFWAFVSLELALHSLHIFSGFDTTQPPMLLAFALPHLPKPLPTVILTGMKYMQMGGTLLDDLAAILFALGVLVAMSGWLAG